MKNIKDIMMFKINTEALPILKGNVEKSILMANYWYIAAELEYKLGPSENFFQLYGRSKADIIINVSDQIRNP